MIFFGFRIADRLMQALLEGFRVKALDTNPLVVFLEGFNLLNLLHLLLERIFDLHW